MLDPYAIGRIIGSLLSGAVVGAIVAICAAKREKRNLGIAGFFSCVVASFLLGLILSIPTCAVFLYFIYKDDKRKKKKKKKKNRR